MGLRLYKSYLYLETLFEEQNSSFLSVCTSEKEKREEYCFECFRIQGTNQARLVAGGALVIQQVLSAPGPTLAAEVHSQGGLSSACMAEALWTWGPPVFSFHPFGFIDELTKDLVF